jgi:hypothetical protein
LFGQITVDTKVKRLNYSASNTTCCGKIPIVCCELSENFDEKGKCGVGEYQSENSACKQAAAAFDEAVVFKYSISEDAALSAFYILIEQST